MPESDGDSAHETSQWNAEDSADLERSKKPTAYDLQISSRDWTVKTIVDQISEGNIDLDPGFQRRNAWRDSRRSRLIESFILSFPVPQIVLAEHPKKKKHFIVIDGKQRLMTIASTYLSQYRGYWQETELSGLKILSKLNDVSLDALIGGSKYANERRQLDNADIRTTVISGFSDDSILYDIFYRINTGSVPLSSQELRQVLNRGAFAKYLMEQTSKENPLWTVLGITQPDARLRDVELLLRLIAWKQRSREYKGNMKPFLDDTMSELNTSWATSSKAVVERVVPKLLEGVGATVAVFGEDAGKKYSETKFESALNRAVFEVQAYYFSFPKVRKAALERKGKVVAAFKALCSDTEFRTTIEATTKSIENYRTRFEMYRAAIGAVVGETLEPLALGRP